MFGFWFGLTKKFHGDFLFDEQTVPYAFTISSELTEGTNTIEWNESTIDLYKREIGDWVGDMDISNPRLSPVELVEDIPTNITNDRLIDGTVTTITNPRLRDIEP